MKHTQTSSDVTEDIALENRAKNLVLVSRLAIAGAAVIAMIVLAGSLSNLELQSGDSALFRQLLQWIFQKFSFKPLTGISLALKNSEFLIAVVRLLFISLPFAVIYFIISPSFRRQVMAKMMIWLPLILILYLLTKRVADQVADPNANRMKPLPPDISIGTSGSFEQFSEFGPHSSQWITVTASFILALLVTMLLLFFARAAWRTHRRESPVATLAGAAQNALETFKAGGDFENIVIQCYAEMSDVLKEYRGIQRQETTTPREFEHHLEELGFPRKPVRQLTRTFEAVRYGAIHPGSEEEQQAVACLTAIIEACHQTK